MAKYINKREDKELIRKDVCARLMTGIYLSPINPEDFNNLHTIRLDEEYWVRYSQCEVLQSIPILRSLSSMTEKERKEYENLRYDHSCSINEYCTEIVDFFISHYLDYRGLIKRGLAKEDTKELYKKVYNLDI